MKKCIRGFFQGCFMNVNGAKVQILYISVIWKLFTKLSACINCDADPVWILYIISDSRLQLLCFGSVLPEIEFKMKHEDRVQNFTFNLREFVVVLANHLGNTALFIYSTNFRGPKIIGQLLAQLFFGRLCVTILLHHAQESNKWSGSNSSWCKVLG